MGKKVKDVIKEYTPQEAESFLHGDKIYKTNTLCVSNSTTNLTHFSLVSV